MSFTYENIDGNPIARVETRVPNPDYDRDDEGSKKYHVTKSKLIYLDCDGESDEDEEEKDIEAILQSLPRETIDIIIKGVDKGLDIQEMLSLVAPSQAKSNLKSLGSYIELPKDTFVVPMPNQKTDDFGVTSERVYVAGKSGLGKSTWTVNYAREYSKLFPENEIIVFSRHLEDPVYDDSFQYEQITLDESILGQDIDMEDLRDKLVILDDCDNLQDKNIAKYIQKLCDDILTNGRKYGISVVYISHQIMNYTKTRNVLNEANRTVFFLNDIGKHNATFLDKYAGLNKNMISTILNLKSRWAALSYGCKPHILHEHGMFIIPKDF